MSFYIQIFAGYCGCIKNEAVHDFGENQKHLYFLCFLKKVLTHDVKSCDFKKISSN